MEYHSLEVDVFLEPCRPAELIDILPFLQCSGSHYLPLILVYIYDELRTGTFVFMRVSLHTYDIPSHRTKRERYVPSPLTLSLISSRAHNLAYQIYADRAKILLPSEELIDLRTKRFAINIGGRR